MKDILIVLLLIAVVILVFGAVNQDQQIDFDYVAGTWRQVSVLTLAGIAAGLVFFVGLGAAVVARYHVLSDRRKLERELQEVYVRLRAAERAAGAGEGRPGVEAARAQMPAPREGGAVQEPALQEWAPLPIVPGRSEEATTIMSPPTGREQGAGAVPPAPDVTDAARDGRTEALTTELPGAWGPGPREERQGGEAAGKRLGPDGAGPPEAPEGEGSRRADEAPDE